MNNIATFPQNMVVKDAGTHESDNSSNETNGKMATPILIMISMLLIHRHLVVIWIWDLLYPMMFQKEDQKIRK